MPPWPTPQEASAFVEDYIAARASPFTAEERRAVNAAAVYSLAYATRCVHALGDALMRATCSSANTPKPFSESTAAARFERAVDVSEPRKHFLGEADCPSTSDACRLLLELRQRARSAARQDLAIAAMERVDELDLPTLDL